MIPMLKDPKIVPRTSWKDHSVSLHALPTKLGKEQVEEPTPSSTTVRFSRKTLASPLPSQPFPTQLALSQT